MSDPDSARWAAIGGHYTDKWASANEAFAARYTAMADTYLAKDSTAGARYAALGEHFARQWAATDEASTARYRGLGDYFASGGSDYLCSIC